MTHQPINLPQAVEVERHIIGAMLLDQDAAATAIASLKTADFYDVRYGLIFGVIASLTERNQSADALTVIESLKAAGSYDRAGGDDVIREVVGEVVSAAALPDYCRIVKDKALKRKQIKLAAWLHEAALGGTPASDVQAELERSAFGLHEQSRAARVLRPIRDVLADSFNAIAKMKSGAVTGLPTGLKAIDAHMGGLSNGDMVVLAGRPGQGKTSLGAQIGINVAKTGKVAAFFECEMKDRAVVDRALFAEAGISQQAFKHGHVPQHLWPELDKASDKLAPIPFYINDAAGITPMEIRSQLRRTKREIGLDLIVVDNIQRMKSDTRTADVRVRTGEVSAALKEIAKEFDVPLIAISHIRRLQSGEVTEPTLSDLQESGNIEQDADIVIALFNESMYKEVPEQAQDKVKVSFLKYREGSLGFVELFFKKELTKFVDLEDRPQTVFDPDRFTAGVQYGSR